MYFHRFEVASDFFISILNRSRAIVVDGVAARKGKKKKKEKVRQEKKKEKGQPQSLSELTSSTSITCV